MVSVLLHGATPFMATTDTVLLLGATPHTEMTAIALSLGVTLRMEMTATAPSLGEIPLLEVMARLAINGATVFFACNAGRITPHKNRCWLVH